MPSGVAAPESPATIAHLPQGGGLVMIFNPGTEHGISGPGTRTPLSASVSKDEGRTWSQTKLIESSLECPSSRVSIHKNRHPTKL